MKAVILRKPFDLVIGDIRDPGPPGPGDVRVKVGSVGICGSDVHYFEFGRIGDFVLKSPLVLGHETSGTVEAVGEGVANLKPGDRVAMEPGLPCGVCRICRSGRYNLCAHVRFWATPPVHGSLSEYLVHPSAFTYKLPESMSLADGALMEPMAVGVHACNRVGVRPGDVVAINGAGTIGCMAMLATFAAGSSQLIVSDIIPERLERAKRLGATSVVDARNAAFADAVLQQTGGEGADSVFECSGHKDGVQTAVKAVRRGGRIALIGMGHQPVQVDTVAAMAKEVDLLPIFRYANAFPTAIKLAARGTLRLEELVTDRFPLDESIKAFDLARKPRASTGKVMIEFR